MFIIFIFIFKKIKFQSECSDMLSGAGRPNDESLSMGTHHLQQIESASGLDLHSLLRWSGSGGGGGMIQTDPTMAAAAASQMLSKQHHGSNPSAESTALAVAAMPMAAGCWTQTLWGGGEQAQSGEQQQQ